MKYEDLLGIRYVEGGRDPEVGLDCWGLCLEVCRRAGLTLPDFQGSIQETADLMETHIPEFEQLPGPEPYALVAFRLHGPFVNHVGVLMADKISFIHNFKGRNVVVERLDHPAWKHRIAGFYKYKAQI
jgi:cell wall-associated NlpC family hydrolase